MKITGLITEYNPFTQRSFVPYPESTRGRHNAIF